MGFWTCQGCGTALDDGHPDVITGHVHDCPSVDGAGQPLFGPEAQCRHCGRPGTLAIRRTYRSEDVMPVRGFHTPDSAAMPCILGEPADERVEITGQVMFCRACDHKIPPPDGYTFTGNNETGTISRAADGSADGSSRSGQASVIPTDEQRHPAVTRYLQAVNRFSEEIISWVSAAIRAAFPRAAWMETFGFDNEDGELKVQALRIYDAADTMLADAENAAGDADRAFAELADKMSLDLDWLGQINGEDYIGTQRIDLT